ncbi:carbamoyltransferase HypF [Helicobacter suis]|uniref:carbamoyltransferase HypF n=1 Tax=Helicobacter suis TaxID=104628 RepID=UPI0013D2944D|nr:carbamoyltransferase HypF [Helicobacter suis]
MHARIIISGGVQGVGFRPFVYKLAKQLGAHGFVRNIGGRVEVVLEKALLSAFLQALKTQLPHKAYISHIEHHNHPPLKTKEFIIAPSLSPRLSLQDTLPLDLAICEACLKDFNDPSSRFFNYPFVACAHCGPRFSLLKSLPYDRAHTSMHAFKMCTACQEDYTNPSSRRFFAQSLSCPNCPISLIFYDPKGKHIKKPLEKAIEAILAGEVVGLKGIGGFALVCQADNKEAVQIIRTIKARPFKPLAMMLPSLEKALEIVHLSPLEYKTLSSAIAPIVLALKKDSYFDHLAPNLDSLGVILPYSGLHYLLTRACGSLVFTSANLKGEPIITDLKNLQAKLPLKYILDHNRPIVHGIDDSIMRCVGQEMGIVRLARGLAPLYLNMKAKSFFIGMGAHNKASLCFAHQDKALVVPDLGSLDSVASIEHYKNTLDFYIKLYGQPESIGIDKHPRYISSQIGQKMALNKAKLMPIQHHRAHFHALLAEWELEHKLREGVELLGFIADGFGLGTNQELWGCEVFKACFKKSWQVKRILSLKNFLIPQSERLIKDSKVLGYALAYQYHLTDLLESLKIPHALTLQNMLDKQIQVCSTTSLGRLFDAIAAFCGVGALNTYEGQAAMQLESLARSVLSDAHYSFKIYDQKILYASMLEEIQSEILQKKYALVARKFHNTLAHIAFNLAQSYKLPILFGGGVFLNRLLCECISNLFKNHPFFLPKLLPCSDASLAFGQVHFLANLKFRSNP